MKLFGISSEGGFMDFYTRLCDLIKQNGLSQRKVEQDLGFSSAAISKWKKYMPNADKLQKVADYFNVSTEYLLTGKEKEGGEEYYLNPDARDMAQFLFDNPEYKVLFDASRKVKKEDIQFVKEMMDRMSNQ